MRCVFCSIVKGEEKAYNVYEDNEVIAFLDINPVSKGHTLVVSKKHYENIFDVPESILCRMVSVAKKISIALREALGADGVNLMMTNNPAAGQVIMHIHIHVIPRYYGDEIHFHHHRRRITHEQMASICEEIRRHL